MPVIFTVFVLRLAAWGRYVTARVRACGLELDLIPPVFVESYEARGPQSITTPPNGEGAC